jgi:hypothetical protein
MAEEKVVLYKYFGKYVVTTEENYNRRILDGNLIIKMPDCCSKEDCINALVNSGAVKDINNIIDKTGE